MRTYYFTDERNTLVLISLLKKHGIRNIIINPGTQNICFVSSVQKDPFFRLFSSADERSAMYMACGMASETGEGVVVCCTGATASRNYFPGLTEAYYRKLPILALTYMRHFAYVGNNVPQVIDRRGHPQDCLLMGVQIPAFNTDEDERLYTIEINNALLEMFHRGGGPVHINIANTENKKDFSVKTLPDVRTIHRYTMTDNLPHINNNSKVAVFVGQHQKWTLEEEKQCESFCEKYKAVVICDQTSNYHGKYKAFACKLLGQNQYETNVRIMDVLIHIGNVSGSYMRLKPREVWRVNSDGCVRDAFGTLTKVFEMEEKDFFSTYNSFDFTSETMYQDQWSKELSKVDVDSCQLPFSNAWVAQKTYKRLPDDCEIHYGVLNSLRSWNFFEINKKINGFCNTGGFGIDGCLSTLIGSALMNDNKIFYAFLGDLAFFYDINSLGNRHLPPNIRIVLINNGLGQEFKNYSNDGYKFAEEANLYIAAEGHYGHKSRDLVRHFCEDLGFEYYSTENEQQYIESLEILTSAEHRKKPLLIEVFTSSELENDALYRLRSILDNTQGKAKSAIKCVIGDNGVKTFKKILGK